MRRPLFFTEKKMKENVKNQLIAEAKRYAEKAYCPYSGYAVGAAVLTEDGRIYGGCNIENASYSLTICAERVAISKAVSDGAEKFTAICIYSAGGKMPYPCGACRQFIAEFSDDAEVIVTDGKEVCETKSSKLLPCSFR